MGLFSRFEVQCRRSHYNEPGCRRRIKEMLALMMVDEDGQKARNKASAIKRLMLEREHLGDSASTFVFSHAHQY